MEMQKKDFEEFVNKSSRILERAMDQEFDVVGGILVDDDEKVKFKKDKVTQQFVFQPQVQMKRAVNSIDWSPAVPELLLASYSHSKEQRVDEADGLVNIFSLGLKGRPEMTLTCQNEVTKALFNPHHPNIVIGATQSGYIVQWDMRAKTIPVLKSNLAKDGH